MQIPEGGRGPMALSAWALGPFQVVPFLWWVIMFGLAALQTRVTCTPICWQRVRA